MNKNSEFIKLNETVKDQCGMCVLECAPKPLGVRCERNKCVSVEFEGLSGKTSYEDSSYD